MIYLGARGNERVDSYIAFCCLIGIENVVFFILEILSPSITCGSNNISLKSAEIIGDILSGIIIGVLNFYISTFQCNLSEYCVVWYACVVLSWLGLVLIAISLINNIFFRNIPTSTAAQRGTSSFPVVETKNNSPATKSNSVPLTPVRPPAQTPARPPVWPPPDQI
jgi:hypothetical protein